MLLGSSPRTQSVQQHRNLLRERVGIDVQGVAEAKLNPQLFATCPPAHLHSWPALANASPVWSTPQMLSGSNRKNANRKACQETAFLSLVPARGQTALRVSLLSSQWALLMRHKEASLQLARSAALASTKQLSINRISRCLYRKQSTYLRLDKTLLMRHKDANLHWTKKCGGGFQKQLSVPSKAISQMSKYMFGSHI